MKRWVAEVLTALVCAGMPAAEVLAGDAVRVAAGDAHTCAVTSSGGVVCWGRNSSGQIGDGTTTDRGAPTPVVGLSGAIVAITAGYSHTCALTSAGGVLCWGDNGFGQVGDGTNASRFTATPVTGLPTNIVAVAAGGWHTCALTTGGGLTCWGYNSNGQLGDGTTAHRQTPATVSGLASAVRSVTAGRNHTCVVTTAGGARCWGYNIYGQLGDGTSTDRATPAAVSNLDNGVLGIEAGDYHSCAITAGGSVQCWGLNSDGRVGDGSMTNRLTPVYVSGLASGGRAVSAGGSHTCAIKTIGGVVCWGNNHFGQAGDGVLGTPLTPAPVSGLSGDVPDIGAGGSHTCAVTVGGDLLCWGSNAYSQLGIGSVTRRLVPTGPSSLANGVTAITADGSHACAASVGGGAVCWGANESRQLGDGTSVSRGAPAPVAGLTSAITALAADNTHTCALTATGGVMCWGADWYGELGGGDIGGYRPTPIAAQGWTTGVTAIAAGGAHTCAVTAAGGAACRGYNAYGQIGDGTTTNRLASTPASGLANGVLSLAAGNHHTCAVTAGGGVACWGWNVNGQLGDGTTTNRAAPTPVSGLASGATAIAVGTDHTCALVTGGGVLCWGSNTFGQLGDGTTTGRTTPVGVSGLASGAVAIAAGWYHTCAVTSAGGLVCWGWNGEGGLGDGTTTQRLTPTAVTGLTSPVTAVAAGFEHTCALAAGGVVCWGDDTSGQLGLGTRVAAPTPVVVYGFGGTISANSVGPAHGPIGGGTRIAIAGAYFLQGATVTIGGTPATGVTIVSTETITAVAGAHSAGSVDIVVRNPDGSEVTLANGFTYEVLGGADFTGDLKSDVLWRHATGGDLWLWPMDGTARTAETYVRTLSDPTWEIRAIADFDGDGKADLLWRNTATGQIYLWPMDGATPMSETYVGTVSTTYDIVGSGDFNGDGKADLLWRHTTLGDVWVWLMDGATPLAEVYVDRVDPAYVVKGVGDLDGDGKADIVWHHATLGEVWVWPMHGTTRLDQVWVGTVPDTGYQIEGVADVDGNGKADLVWWHATRGEVWVWTMNGPARVAETWVGTVPDTSYQIAGTGDYNGDGKADLLWRNGVNGEVWMWLMSGPVRVSETWVATVPDTGYRITR